VSARGASPPKMPARKPAKALPARVEAIIARNANVAVIFRRGPTRLVRMLKWNLRNDRIEGGQWIEARVHVSRSDISPNGKLVACFVASYRKMPGTWTALSQPPWFTALAVWPKGDTWGGGGLFVSDDHFLLGHDTRIQYGIDQFKLLPDFATPRRFRVQSFQANSPVPACEVEQARMVLSGWRFVQRRVVGRRAMRAPDMDYPFEQPEILARVLDDPKQPRFVLRRVHLGYAPVRRQGGFSIQRAEIHDLRREAQHDLGPVDWVDADHKGDVLWSRHGRLFRLAGPTRQGMKLDAEPKLVADLNAMTFEATEAPKSALKWP
jgi:hypothetical protein